MENEHKENEHKVRASDQGGEKGNIVCYVMQHNVNIKKIKIKAENMNCDWFV